MHALQDPSGGHGVVPPSRGVAELDAREWQDVMAINTWGVAATLGGLTQALAMSDCGAVVVPIEAGPG